MEALNQHLFLIMNAPPQSNPLVVWFAIVMAQYAIFCVPLVMIAGWLSKDEHHHKMMLTALLATAGALLINNLIGSLLWYHPRPFMMPLGHTLISHAPTPSFPSNHMTIISTVAFSFLLRPTLRKIGLVMAILACPVAWSRIYLGVHFPLDMLGAVIVAGLASIMMLWLQPLYIERLYGLTRGLYRIVFAPLIARGLLHR
ncbi:Undecaprenyl-diphosphatase [Kushneria avicenniae]|uniref:undecaprenyl-diphosphate phosphatase n=1 Tax=Kushneria avicenniae TaxID=402385 RepID=A0A1I1FHM0_9GAMM|nr:undecaprenyl-diphosphatase [Kushneria avicenniae]SFB98482.1 Undecaprenyl-diphosphatase [Kushneria avicenniae]